MAILVFATFVAFVLMLSFYLGNKAKSASGYFAAGGQINWGVNGIAFAGDYLSAASFLGICGMIAFSGYDGFLYSIGYLAGWIVALFVVAEPMKRLGKYTFTDALDYKFNSKGIQLAAGISTLVVSVCYLIPQMVGAGSLVTPLLGLEHHWGVIMVGSIVIFIVATAGMASTTYVQFLKGTLLIIFSTILVIAMCNRGLSTTPQPIDKSADGKPCKFHQYQFMDVAQKNGKLVPGAEGYELVRRIDHRDKKTGAITETFAILSHLVPLTENKAVINETERTVYQFTVKDRLLYLPWDKENKLEALKKRDIGKIVMINGKPHIYITNNDGEKVPALFIENSAIIGGIKVVEKDGALFVKVLDWWRLTKHNDKPILQECQSKVINEDKKETVNGVAAIKFNENMRLMGNLNTIAGKTGEEAKTGRLGMFEYLATILNPETKVNLVKNTDFTDDEDKIWLAWNNEIEGKLYMRPGQKFPLRTESIPMPKNPSDEAAMRKHKATQNKANKKGVWNKINFASLMLALFFGTSALPHILIRYYTVPSAADARKSTILAIAAIGFFYVLTLYLGTGATVNGTVNPMDNNMSAPLLARSFGELLFAVISAIAFATVLGTVSGLIVAASGAVAHDLLDRYGGLNMTDKQKVGVGKLAAFAVGLVAIILGIVFKGVNVSFLVGWAFAVAASANLPAIIMLLFWKKTTAKGIVASIFSGTVFALGIILLSPKMYKVYGTEAASLISLDNPGIVSIPVSFMTLVVVSLLTQPKNEETSATESPASPETPIQTESVKAEERNDEK